MSEFEPILTVAEMEAEPIEAEKPEPDPQYPRRYRPVLYHNGRPILGWCPRG